MSYSELNTRRSSMNNRFSPYIYNSSIDPNFLQKTIDIQDKRISNVISRMFNAHKEDTPVMSSLCHPISNSINLGAIKANKKYGYSSTEYIRIIVKLECSKRKQPIRMNIVLNKGLLSIYVCRDYSEPTYNNANQIVEVSTSGLYEINGGTNEKIFSCDSIYIAIESRTESKFQFHYAFADQELIGHISNKFRPKTSGIVRCHTNAIAQMISDIRNRKVSPNVLYERAKSVRIKKKEKLFALYKCDDAIKSNINVNTAYSRFLTTSISHRTFYGKRHSNAKSIKNQTEHNELTKSILSSERWNIKSTIKGFVSQIRHHSSECKIFKGKVIAALMCTQFCHKINEVL